MQATLISITDETSDGSIKTFRFSTTRSLGHLPGQFTEVHIPHDNPDGRGIMRQFTISSAPNASNEASITVNFRDSRSSFKQALLKLRPDDEVRIDEPMGDFVLPLNTDTPLVWIAGGIGITPFLSMAAQLKADGEKRDIILLHSISNLQDRTLSDPLEASGIKRSIINTDQQQRLTAKTILDTIGFRPGSLLYISGPEAMVGTMLQDLVQHGIRRDDIVTDAFLGYS